MKTWVEWLILLTLTALAVLVCLRCPGMTAVLQSPKGAEMFPIKQNAAPSPPPAPPLTDPIQPDVYWVNIQWASPVCGFQPLLWTNSTGAYSALIAWSPGPTNLCWEGSTWTNAASYVVQWSLIGSGVTNWVDAGTNTQAWIEVATPPMTNLVLTVTATSGATNLYAAGSLFGPWVPLGTTNWVVTNPVAPLFFRATGNASSGVNISQTRS